MRWFGSLFFFFFHKSFKPMNIGDSVLVAAFRGFAIEIEGDRAILRHSISTFVKGAEVVLAPSVSLLCGHTIPLGGLRKIAREALAILVHERKIVLRSCMPLFRCHLVPVRGLNVVLFHAIPIKRHLTKAANRLWVFEEFQLMGKVFSLALHLLDFGFHMLVGSFPLMRTYQIYRSRCPDYIGKNPSKSVLNKNTTSIRNRICIPPICENRQSKYDDASEQDGSDLSIIRRSSRSKVDKGQWTKRCLKH